MSAFARLNGKLVGSVRPHFAAAAALTVLALALLVFLTARNAGMYPSVFADEWFYNLFSRLSDIKFSQRPSYLYFAAFGLTDRCGDGFLECARLFNTVFFVASIPLIYSLARYHLPRTLALWITALSVFSPVNAYSAYFMPESMYYFGFFLFAWITLKGMDRKPVRAVIFASFTLAALTMVKVHAVFLLPGLWIVILLPFLSKPGTGIALRACMLAVLSVLAFLCFRLGLGYSLVGSAGFNILGTDYAATASSASGMEQLRLLLPLIAFNLWGNILAIAAMFALPLALLLNIDIRDGQDDDVPRSRLRALVLFTGTLLTLLVLVTALFFARVQGTSPYENIARISLRYYDFLFPLLFIIVAAAAHRAGNSRQQNYFKLAGIVAVTLIAAYAVGFRLNGYLPGIADSPELRAFTYNPHVFWGLGALGILCCVIALYRLRIGAMVYVWLFLPLTIVLSAHFTNKEMRLRLVSDAYDEAGQFAQRYLGADVAKLAIVAPELVSIFRTHFYMRTAENTFISLPNGTRIDPAAIPTNIEWILMLGSYKLPFVPKQSVHIPFKHGSNDAANSDTSGPGAGVDAYTLVRIASKVEVNFLGSSLGPAVTKIEGLSEAESVGRWSTGREVVLTFSKALPNRFELVLDAFALGPNVDKAIKLGVNGKQYAMRLSGQPSTVIIQVDSDRSDNKITFEIPVPVSLKELGSSPDPRTLGVALRHLIVREPIQIRE